MNRKVKAIVDAAVAMGYGETSDYSGNSVGAVLEEFAAIAEQGGGGGAGTLTIEVEYDEGTGTYGSETTYEDIVEAFNAKASIYVKYFGNIYYLYFINDEQAEFRAYPSISYDAELGEYNLTYFEIVFDENGVTGHQGISN